MYITIKRHDYFTDYPININGIMRVEEYICYDFDSITLDNSYYSYYFCEIIYLDRTTLRTRYTKQAILRRINKALNDYYK